MSEPSAPGASRPNPGSAEAVAAGCTCPVIDNGRGRGSTYGAGMFWITDGCPLHAAPAETEPREP